MDKYEELKLAIYESFENDLITENEKDFLLDYITEKHWDTLLTRPEIYFKKSVTMYHYSNTKKDTVIPITINAGNKLAKPRFSSWWTPQRSQAGWVLSNVLFSAFKENKWKDVLWSIEEFDIDGERYKAPKTIIGQSFFNAHEKFIKSIDVYEHKKVFKGSDLGRGNEYSVDEFTCDFAVKPDSVKRIDWEEMTKLISIVPDEELINYQKMYNNMMVNGKHFQDLVHNKKPWIYWEFEVSNEIRAKYCKEHDIDFKVDEEYFRFKYHGIGIYEALKQHVSPDTWKKLLSSNIFTWLPKPNYYSDTCISYFTKEGRNMFIKRVLPICKKYFGDDIEFSKVKNIKNIVYKDKYQIIVDDNQDTKNESVNNIKLSIYESFENNLITESEKDFLLNYIEEKKTTAEYRLQKFKKDHDYDPKTQTIVMNGERSKFKYIDGSKKHNSRIKASSHKDKDNNERTIIMNRNSFNLKNPNSHEFIANHEKGHEVVARYRDDDWEKDYDMDKAVTDVHKKLNIDRDKLQKHGKNLDEYLSDYYAANHIKNPDKTIKDTNNSINKINRKADISQVPPKRIKELKEQGISGKEALKKCKEQIKNENKAREKTIKELRKYKELDFLK